MFLLMAIIMGCSNVGPDDGLPLGGVMPGGGFIFPQMTTLRDQKFDNVVRQQTDFSCGAAALATLLKYAYGMKLNEKDVFMGMYVVSDKAELRQRGFSLLDMKKYLDNIGVQGVGYKITDNALFIVKVPVIVLLNIGGYEHFVVMRKATPNGVFVADPALGNRSMPIDSFFKDWQFNIIFAVISNKYDPENPLIVLEKPLSPTQQVRSLMPAFNPLNEQILSTVLISATPGLKVGD
jgi:uncharacterized protein